MLPPQEQLCGGRVRFVSTCDRCDRRPVCGSRRLDREDVLGCWEERLADGRVLDQVEDVGGVPPEVGGGHCWQLAAELLPCGCPIAPMGDRIGPAEGAVDRLANRVVDHEPVVPDLDEGESS